MLEKLNSLSFVGETRRPLNEQERQAILARLQQKTSMTWLGVRRTLAPLFKARGEAGEEKALKFNQEEEGEKGLAGNAVEAKLEKIFGRDWQDHPYRQEIRDSVPLQLWQADYEIVGNQRVVILSRAEREIRRTEVMRDLAERYDLTDAQSSEIQALQFPPGWERYSIEALQEILPHLEAGVSFVDIVSSPEWEEWRNERFPGRKRPTHWVLDRLPSPADPEENRRIAGLRNPTAVRTHNELRKVVNNLIDLFGKPDVIRVSVTPDIGKSKRQREERQVVVSRQERLRKAAEKSLRDHGEENPSRRQVEKWLLWEECGRQCPFTGDSITFDDLFRTGKFLVEPIWPLSRTLEDSYRNRTLCRKDVSAIKGNRTPYEFFRDQPWEWDALVNRVSGTRTAGDGKGLPAGKSRKFISASIPDGFASRKFYDTSHTAREILACLEKLWRAPDWGGGREGFMPYRGGL